MKLDVDRVQKLIRKLLEPVKRDMEKGPVNRERVFEALNALAVVTACVLNATGEDSVDETAGEFFRAALNVHLKGSPDHQPDLAEGSPIFFVPGQTKN
jgi:hypothetical protein